MPGHRHLILVAIGEPFLREAVRNRLTQAGYGVQEVSTVHAARDILNQQPISCVVMTSQFAVPNGTTSLGIMALLVDRVPTVTLLAKDSLVAFDTVYRPPFHEYETLPCDLDYLSTLVARVLSYDNA